MHVRVFSLLIFLIVQVGAPAPSPESAFKCDAFEGNDAGAKIAACIAALPLAGGIADARGIVGQQSIANTVAIDRPVRLLLGNTTYTFTGTTIIFYITANNVVIEGLGPTSSVITTANAVDGLNPTTNTRIANFTLRGPNIIASGFSGIDTGNATGVLVEDMLLEHWGDAAINQGGNSGHWTIRNNTVRNNKQNGIFLPGGSTGGNTVTGNTIHDNGANGIDINGSYNFVATNTLFNNGKTFSGSDCFGILIATVSTNADYNSIIGNTVESSQCQGIIVKSSSGWTTNFNFISGNTITGSKKPTGDGIAIDSTAGGTQNGNTIASNIVRRNARHGVLVDGSVGVVVDNVVAGNVVETNAVTGILVTGVNSRDTTIINNIVMNNGLDLDYSTSIRTLSGCNQSGVSQSPCSVPFAVNDHLAQRNFAQHFVKVLPIRFAAGRPLMPKTCYDEFLAFPEANSTAVALIGVPRPVSGRLGFTAAASGNQRVTVTACNETSNPVANPGEQIYRLDVWQFPNPPLQD